LAFFDDSLRTQAGFGIAAARLGLAAMSVTRQREVAVMGRPESLADSLASVSPWFDAVCLRHPDPHAFASAVKASKAAVVNCGNGCDEHPTQALIDLARIADTSGGVDGLHLAIVGDLHAMRAAHSLVLALSCFDVAVTLISPPGHELPAQYVQALHEHQRKVVETTEMALGDADVIYVAGLPGVGPAGSVSHEVQAQYRLTLDLAQSLSTSVRIHCPLPRIDEIEGEVDQMPQAAYFRSDALDVAVRMTVLEAAVDSNASVRWNGC
jgi:aspartate carbamoyltransferase catalytic subunit